MVQIKKSVGQGLHIISPRGFWHFRQLDPVEAVSSRLTDPHISVMADEFRCSIVDETIAIWYVLSCDGITVQFRQSKIEYVESVVVLADPHGEVIPADVFRDDTLGVYIFKTSHLMTDRLVENFSEECMGWTYHANPKHEGGLERKRTATPSQKVA
jgi:hypothetical protein